jgi:hypothetical protein
VGPFASIGPPVFRPDSRHIAYAAAHGDKWGIILDDNRDDVDDGLVCPSIDTGSDAKWRPIGTLPRGWAFDEMDYFKCPQVPYHFDADGTLLYFRVSDGHLYRVHWKPEDATTAPATRP